MKNPARITILICVLQLILLGTWYLLDETRPMKIAVIIFCVLALPLLLCLPGMIKRHRRSFQWVGFLSIAYICHSVMELISNPDVRLYASIEFSLAMLLFVASSKTAKGLASQPAVVQD